MGGVLVDRNRNCRAWPSERTRPGLVEGNNDPRGPEGEGPDDQGAHASPIEPAKAAAERGEGDGRAAAGPQAGDERIESCLNPGVLAGVPPVVLGGQVDDEAPRLGEGHELDPARAQQAVAARGPVGGHEAGEPAGEGAGQALAHDTDAVDRVHQDGRLGREEIAVDADDPAGSSGAPGAVNSGVRRRYPGWVSHRRPRGAGRAPVRR